MKTETRITHRSEHYKNTCHKKDPTRFSLESRGISVALIVLYSVIIIYYTLYPILERNIKELGEKPPIAIESNSSNLLPECNSYIKAFDGQKIIIVKKGKELPNISSNSLEKDNVLEVTFSDTDMNDADCDIFILEILKEFGLRTDVLTIQALRERIDEIVKLED